jgi:REP-associated tyrosine transposase
LFSIRLTGYDYSQSGYYFITLITQNREKLFGEIQDKKMELNDIGQMIDIEWNQIPNRFKHAVLDQYIIMPDHFHGIIQIKCNKIISECNDNNVGSQCMGTSSVPAGKTTLFDIIGAFKSITTNVYINGVKNNNWPRINKRLWQLRFHDHIIRNKNELNRIRNYIIANPFNYSDP